VVAALPRHIPFFSRPYGGFWTLNPPISNFLTTYFVGAVTINFFRTMHVQIFIEVTVILLVSIFFMVLIKILRATVLK
jgi:multisubunit Na+/H+ antiporter MnhE subunit